MRSFWLWIAGTLIVYTSLAQDFLHYRADPPPVNQIPPPECYAGGYLQATCQNHHVAIGLSAVGSKHFSSLRWSTTHPSFTISNPTSVTPILKLKPGQSVCDDKVLVKLVVWGKDQTAQDSCEMEVGVTDHVKPTFTVNVADMTVECDDVPSAPYVAAKDDCDKAIDVKFSEYEEKDHGESFIYREWVAIDRCGNTNRMKQKVFVQDDDKPQLVGVEEDLAVTCGNIPKPCVVVAYDNCDDFSEVDFEEIVLPGTCADDYRIVRTWTAIDNAYNQASDDQTITVSDKEAPTLLGLPSDLNFDCNAIPSIDDFAVTALDNCDDDLVFHANENILPGNCPHAFVVRMSWDATDDCGNFVQASADMTVSALPPRLAGIQETNVEIQCDSDMPICEPEVNDPCDYGIDIDYEDDVVTGTCPDEKWIYRKWTVQNVCGLGDTVVQTVHVVDTEPPYFTSTPPANKVVECDHIPTYTLRASDNCDEEVWVQPEESAPGQLDEYQIANYQIYRSWTATDNCGHTDTIFQTITVSDTTPPVIVGIPPDLTVECDSLPDGGANDITFYDPCPCEHSDPKYEQETIPGSCPSQYRLVRIWTVKDCSGNSATGQQTIWVIDTTPPQLVAYQGTSSIPIEAYPMEPYVGIECTDVCGLASWTESLPERRSGSCSHDFKIITTWDCVDECGLSVRKSHTIHVFDKSPPVLVNVPSGYLTWECDDVRLNDYSTNEILNGKIVTVTDNSDGAGGNYQPAQVFFKKDREPGTCEHSYVLVLKWTAVDDCLNSVEEEITIDVVDYEPPVISKPQRKVVTDDCNIPDPDVTATDNCDEVSVTLVETTSTDEYPCPSQFNILREWTATDECGNIATPVKQIIEVIDKVAPEWITYAPTDYTVPCVYEPDSIWPVAIDPNCYDNYTQIDLVYSESKFQVACKDEYKVARKWTASDCLGNFAFQFQTVTVVDNDPPVFTYTPVDETVSCFEPPVPVVTATDNCLYAPQVKFFEDTDYNCPKDFVLYRKWIATDACGNAATHTQTVVVQDNEVPVLTAPEDSVMSCDETPRADDATCTDDCSYVTLKFKSEQVSGECPHNYLLIRSWHCEDECGKYVTHTQSIHVADLDPPVFDSYVPPFLTVECDDIPKAETTIGGSDNCGYPLIGVLEQVGGNPSYGGAAVCDHTLERNWIIKDTCGNTASYYQTITILDTTPPVLYNVPAAITVPCDAIHYWDNVYAKDNCDPDLTVDYNIETIQSICTHIYTQRRVWTACDHCGNCVTGEQLVQVDDHDKPIFIDCQPSFHYTSPTITLENVDDEVPQCVAWDNCDDDVNVVCTVEKEPGCTDDDYTLTRTCQAYDDCGNGGYPVTQIFEIEDVEPCPFINFPEDVTVSCEVNSADVYSQPEHDCAFMTLAESVIPQSCEDESKIIKTFTITDYCGNSRSESQTITFIDDVDPTIDYADLGPITEQCETPLKGFLSVSDNCDYGPTQTYKEVQLEYNCAHNYVVEQQWFIKDRCENSKYVTRTITVQDTVPPEVGTIPDDITVDHQNVPPYPDYIACSDNCPLAAGAASFSEITLPGSCSEEYTILREWCCEDCYDKVCETQRITVEDNTPPVFSYCPADETHHINPPEHPTLTAIDGYGTEADVSYDQETQYGGYTWARVINREWVAEDNCLNKATCIQKIFITVPPPILCVPDNMTIECVDEGTIPSADDVTLYIDECSGEGMTISYWGEETLPGSCDTEYCLVRTWRALDELKGSLEHSAEYWTKQTICVRDNHGPYWEFPAYRTVDCSKQSELPGYLLVHPVEAYDECGIATVTTCCWTDEGNYGYHWDYTATDECGHTITERMAVVVVDMENPKLSHKPESLIVDCTMDGLFIGNAPVTCEDNCGPTTLTTWSVVLEQACNHRKKVVRGWRCVDEKGNEANHEQTITVVDNEPPSWDGVIPEDMTLECDEDLPTPSTLTAKDNCAYVGYITYLGETHDSPSTVHYGTEILSIIRKWIVYDECGLFVQHAQTIRIYDTKWPELIGVPADNVDAECEACLCDSVTATDNCGSPSMHSWNVTEEGSCPNEKTVITYWEAVDDVGHSIHDSQTLIIRDSNPPEWRNLYAGDMSVQCHEVPPAPPNVQAIDECDSKVAVEYSEDLIQSAYWIESQMFSMGNIATLQGEHQETGVQYDLYRHWVATDSCGHSISKQQIITVDDNTPPVFKMCPRSITVPCSDIPDANKKLVVTDNCATNIYVRFKQTQDPGTCYEEKIIYRHWWAFDTKDNRVDCKQTITVIDSGVPEFTYVPTTKLFLRCDEWSLNYPWPNDVNSVDDCSEATVTPVQSGGTGTCDDEGIWVRVWTTTDNCGNSKDFTQSIIVTDTQPPYCIGCPEHMSLDCSKKDDYPFSPYNWVDECDTNPSTNEDSNDLPTSCSGEAHKVWTLSAEDECGNKASITATVTYTDTTPPSIDSLPESGSYECDFPADAYTTWLDSPSCEDDCSTTTRSRSINVIEGTCLYERKDIHTWTCTDDCGNFESESRTIEIYDTTPPRFTGKPTVTTIECDVDEPVFNVIAADNCDGVFGYTNPIREEVPGTCEGSKVVIYSWYATDLCGNTNSLIFTLTWNDIDTPVLSSFPTPNAEYPCDDLWVAPPVTATDECDNNPVVNHIVLGEATYLVSSYDVVHTWDVVDDCGNADDHSVTYRVVDLTPPTITPTTDIDHGCKDIPPPAYVSCQDNCDPHVDLVYTENRTDGSCVNDYILVRSWICTDNEGLTATSEYTITVTDEEAPIWESTAPHDTTIECDDEDTYSLVHIATDVCDYNVQINVYPVTDGDKCFNKTSYTWVATDSCGHSVTDTWEIVVQDTTKPTLSQYPPDRHIPCTSLDNNNDYRTNLDTYSEIWPGIITASDNCEYVASVKFTLEKVNGECAQDYDLVMTWTASDDCGNVESHSMTVYINDKDPPSWNNVPVDVTISAYSGYDNLATAINDASAVDDCDLYVQITGTENKLTRQYNRDCPNEWVIHRTLTAVDDCGNAIYHTYSISSIDTQAPTLPAIDDITIECDEYDESYEECEVSATSPGDEDLDVTLHTNTGYLNHEDCPDLFKIYKTWTVVDCTGLSGTTTQTVTVQDSTPPVLSRTPDPILEVACNCQEFPAAPDLKAYDNCDEVSVSFDETTEPGSCEQEYSMHRVWSATDSCGNKVTATQDVDFYDEDAPSFCEDEEYTQTYSCDAVPDDLKPSAGDDCDENVEVKLVDDWMSDDLCHDSYTIHYKYSATDDCGNYAETERSFIVQDDTPPVLSDDSQYCLFVSYGNSWGTWAGYNLNHLFRATDNCDENPNHMLEFGSLFCNATDAPSYTPTPKTTSLGSQFIEDCYVIKKSSDYILLVKIDREENPPSQILGRTYHAFATLTDGCGNDALVQRDIFIPLDNAIHEHVQPCETGNPEYYVTPPVVLSRPGPRSFFNPVGGG